MRVASLPKVIVLGAVVCLLAGVMLADAVAAEEVPPGVEWTDQFGSSEDDEGSGVAVDASGVYVTGRTEGALPGRTHAGDRDVWVRKYGPAGNVAWTRQFGTAGDDGGSEVAVHDSGVYVTGRTHGALPGQNHAGEYDVFVRKYDTAGRHVWTRQFGTRSSDIGRGVAVDASGVYVTGFTRGAFPGYTNAGNWDVWVRKYDLDGDEVWTRQFGTYSGDEGNGVAVDATGVYIAGRTGGWLQTGGTRPGAEPDWNPSEGFIRKYDLNGEELWTRMFGLAEHGELCCELAVDATGVYFSGTTSFEPQIGQGGPSNVFVGKFDAAGTHQWSHEFGTDEDDQGSGVAVDDSGVYFTGSTGGALPGQTHAGGTDAFVRKYDQGGNELWTQQYGTSSDDGGGDVAVDVTGVHLHVIGSTRGALPGHTSAGGSDVFVRRYDDTIPTCLGWNVTMAGTAAADTLFGTAGNDVIDARGGDDTVYGRGGDDIICGGDGNDFLYGGDGADQLDSGPGADVVNGSAGDDTLNGGIGDDTIAGNLGNDTLNGGDGNDLLRGWTGGDTLKGGDGSDTLRGWLGDDLLFGGAGNDWLYGAGDDDTLNGDTGDDMLDGGDGTDTLDGGTEADVCTRGEIYNSCEVVIPIEDFPAAEWTRQFGTDGWDGGSGVAVDHAGGVYLTGQVDGVLPGLTSAGNRDVFVRRYDAAGNEGWTRQFGSTGHDYGKGVAVDASGVYVTGAISEQVIVGQEDVFVHTYDLDGDELWTRRFGTDGWDEGRGVAVDHIGGVYVTGNVDGALPGQTSAGGSDVFVRKYNLDGDELWTRQFGTGETDEGFGVSVHASGVYVTGTTRGALPGQTSAGYVDVFVRKYDLDGDELWTRQFGTDDRDEGSGVAVDASGVYVTGTTYGTFPDQTGTSVDVFVRKYDLDGDELWTRQFGSGSTDQGSGVAVDHAGGVYLTGYTQGALPGQTSARRDVFVRKYDLDGIEVWTRAFGTGSNWDVGRGVAVDASGVYVTGYASGAFPGQESAGDADVFVRKYSEDMPPCLGAAVTAVGTDAADTIIGTSGDDVIDARGGDDVVYGRGGNDIICGGPGNDLLNGGDGNDQLDGGEGADTMSGSADDDILHGGIGDDNLSGNLGNDILWGSDGNDTLRGWTGIDTLDGGLGDDWLYGGPDPDTLSGGDGADTLSGGDHDDILNGDMGDDRLWGHQGSDTLDGGDGSDVLKGWLGDDLLSGGVGNDYLDGGDGTDTLDGGPDNDECTNGEIYNSCEVIL